MVMNKSKLITPLFIFLFILIVVFMISLFGRDENAPVVEQFEKREAVVLPINYSRVSFFLGQPVRASLAIPENWEGKYRIKQSARSVSFFYIGAPGEEIKLFSVYLFDQDDWVSSNDNSLVTIGTQDEWTIAYNISIDNMNYPQIN